MEYSDKKYADGFEIYEPFGTRGRVLKKFLPITARLGAAKRILNGRSTSICLNTKLRDLLKKCFGTEWEYSVFWGTPCVDQKVTIQIYNEKEILGYCKLGYSERVKELFLYAL